jgi:hypothetical protein
MARVIYGGFDEAGEMLFGGQRHHGTMQFLQNQASQLSTTLTEAGKSFMSRGAEIYNSYMESPSMMAARSMARQMRHLFQEDSIRPLTTIGAMQNAPLAMQRWVMANPVVREAYHMQRCDGYADTYVDLHPKDVGFDHYDYRRAVNGLMMFKPDGSWEINQILLDPLDGHVDIEELSFQDQLDIQETWQLIEARLKDGKEDPTSRFNASL